MGVKVGPEDEIRVDGKPLPEHRSITLAMNKPTGVLTTLQDPFKRPTVADLLPQMAGSLKPIGRLDQDTEGLLLFSNDGELAFRLSHPRYGVDKEYEAVVKGQPGEDALRRLRTGLFIEGKKTAPAEVEVISHYVQRDETKLKLVLHEGRKRQVRLMCQAVGHPVKHLKRVRFGPIRLGDLAKRTCRVLGKEEVDRLRVAVGLEPSPSAPARKPRAKVVADPVEGQ